MAAINENNQLTFKSAKDLMASINSDLSSLDSMGLINPQKYYKHIKYILDVLGISVYKEYDAVIDIEAYMGQLPVNFSVLHAGFRVRPYTNDNFFNQELGKFSYYIQETCSTVETDCNFAVPSILHPQSKIEYKTFVRGHENTRSWSTPSLMRLAPRTEKSIITDQCINVGAGSADEFAIDVGKLKVYTNFQKDSILLQYYGRPIDMDTGLPQVPEQVKLYKAVEDYIKFKLFEDLWMNSDAQDIQNKFMYWKAESELSLKNALSYTKLFTFDSAIKAIRRNRTKFAPYQIN